MLFDSIATRSRVNRESRTAHHPNLNDTNNYESWSVMDKLEYTTTTNLRLRLAGMFMDMWIFFLFVAIAGEYENDHSLPSYLSLVSLALFIALFRFDAKFFPYLRSRIGNPSLAFPIPCIDSTSVTWSACCHSTCQYALRMHNRHVRHAE